MEYDEVLSRIVGLLENHPEGLTISQIATELGVHRNSISKYADVLVASGRIDARQIGPAKLYTVAARIPLTALLDVSHDAIVLLSADRTVVTMNEAARSIDVEGLIPALDDGISSALSGTQWKGDREHDSVFAVSAYPVTFEDGARGAALILSDVSEQRALESHLRMLERAVDASSCGIVIADMNRDDAPLIYVNPAFERITGYSSEDVLGRNCRFLQNNMNPPERKIIREAIDNGTSCTVVIENYRKDGSRFLNELRLSPVRDETGAITHYIGVQTPVGEREPGPGS